MGKCVRHEVKLGSRERSQICSSPRRNLDDKKEDGQPPYGTVYPLNFSSAMNHGGLRTIEFRVIDLHLAMVAAGFSLRLNRPNEQLPKIVNLYCEIQ
jgi:hypothetical protein